jgi:nicotinamidase-related amidase
MITALDKNTALVVIDLQKGVVQMNVVHPIKDVLEKSALLADAFRKAGLPVVLINVDPTGRAKKRTEQNAPAPPVLPPGFTDLVDDLKIQPSDIRITKKTWNAFYNTTLHQTLQTLDITGIVLAGVSTSVGVEGTARAASELSYNISFATDAMTDRFSGAHDNSLNVIFPRIGELGTSAEIIEKLSSRI